MPLVLCIAPVEAVAVRTAAVSAASAATAKPKPAKPKSAKAKPIDPRRTRGLFVDPRMPAATKGSRYAPLGRKPQALWVTDYYPTSGVQSAVRDYVTRANKQNKTPVLAIYAIPNRDCGRYSAGGLASASGYKAWLEQVARGLNGSHAMVVLEPDAVPDLGDCAGQGNRAALIRWAAKRLSKTDAWTYLDAGNSVWHPASVIAARLKSVGVQYVRGISLNVGNFRATAEQQAYAVQVLNELTSLGVSGKHFIVDTSRNGAKPPDSQVCNPSWARVGSAPLLVFHGAYDGRLWIKHPGESDGGCNGGPSSGAWSDALADHLLGHG
jgi:endoglucanase